MEAMSSTQNVSIADERAPAHMRVVVPQGHDLVGVGDEQTVFVVDADADHPRPWVVAGDLAADDFGVAFHHQIRLEVLIAAFVAKARVAAFVAAGQIGASGWVVAFFCIRRV